jgi:branched-chain amino acid transport system ATP-binding protein
MAAAAPVICLEICQIWVDLEHRSILRGISLSVRPQEIVSIIGPNGAGKTTLFNVICGQLRPSKGSVIFHGTDITRWPPHRICRSGIARTSQIPRPFPEMTTLENVLIGIWFGKRQQHRSSHGTEKARELLELVHLSSKRDIPAKELTLSEQRRLEIARALATEPQLLLLDEIAAGLSPQAIKEAVELVKTLRQLGLTLVVIDHFLNLTSKVSDRLVAVDQGEKIIEGKPTEVLQSPEVISAYLGERHKRES